MSKTIEHIFANLTKPKNSLVSIILPVYNEEGSLPGVIEELFQYLGNNLTHYLFEIVFIDDCSKDRSFNIINSYSAKSPENIRLAVIRLAKNSGSHIAITAGLNISRGDLTIVMASDGQDPAAIIGTLVDEWQQGNELILASRADNLDHNYVEKVLSRFAWKLMIWSTKINMPKSGCDLLAIDKLVLDAFNRMDERNTTFIFRILSLGFKQKEIQYIKRVRTAGKSNWTFFKKISIIFDAITGYTSRPLRLMTNFGLIIVAVLLIRWLIVVFNIYVLHEQPTMLTIILNTIFSALGVQVFLLGIIGNYIWRILDETRKRPLYDINEVGGKIFTMPHQTDEV